jgi:hypothetical protein
MRAFDFMRAFDQVTLRICFVPGCQGILLTSIDLGSRAYHKKHNLTRSCCPDEGGQVSDGRSEQQELERFTLLCCSGGFFVRVR